MSNLPNDLADVKADVINLIADQKGKDFKLIKTNQIRNVFAQINTLRNNFRYANSVKDENEKIKIYEQVKRDLILLKPKLAYAAGRQQVVRTFQVFLFELIDKTVKSKKIDVALDNFFIMVESVVAYHKFHGGN